jgi:hypothetical protein
MARVPNEQNKMGEPKFTLNPFKNILTNPVIYLILDRKSQNVIERVLCVDKKQKKEFKDILKDLEKKGKIKLKKNKTWWQNLKGYSKYTKIQGKIVPIIEYEFFPKK